MGCNSQKLLLLTKGKKIVINSKFKSNNTNLRVEDKLDNFAYYLKSSYDTNNKEVLRVHFFMPNVGGESLVIDFSDKITPKVKLWSDTKQYDGEYYKFIDLENYKIIINDVKFKKGDTIRGRINCDFKHYNNRNYNISGEFMHIVGKTIFVKRNEDKIIHNKPLYNN